MAKVSKNARTDRKVQEGSKDNVKVIFAVKGRTQYGFKDVILHKDKVQDFISNHYNTGETPTV